MEDGQKHLPAPVDGFGDDDDEGFGGSPVLRGGALLRCTDGAWKGGDGQPPPCKRLLAVATTTALQCWQHNQLVDAIVKEPGVKLPDVEELNSKIPREEWDEGIDGQPRPPWQHVVVVYFLDEATARKFTFVSGTIGASMAVGELREQVRCMRMLRGDQSIVPVVELSGAPMKTRFGAKIRPAFNVVAWRAFGAGGEPAQIEPPKPGTPGKVADTSTNKKTGGIHPVSAPTLKKEMGGDEVPW